MKLALQEWTNAIKLQRQELLHGSHFYFSCDIQGYWLLKSVNINNYLFQMIRWWLVMST